MTPAPGGPSGDRDGAPGNGSVHAEYDWSAVTPSTAVVETVSVAIDREPTDVPSLHRVLDPDALDGLVGRVGNDGGDGMVVSFEYADRVVTVSDGGEVAVLMNDGRS